ncbi:MAG: hypothetical protein ABWK01_06950 [Infirmifilum sp.]
MVVVSDIKLQIPEYVFQFMALPQTESCIFLHEGNMYVNTINSEKTVMFQYEEPTRYIVSLEDFELSGGIPFKTDKDVNLVNLVDVRDGYAWFKVDGVYLVIPVRKGSFLRFPVKGSESDWAWAAMAVESLTKKARKISPELLFNGWTYVEVDEKSIALTERFTPNNRKVLVEEKLPSNISPGMIVEANLFFNTLRVLQRVLRTKNPVDYLYKFEHPPNTRGLGLVSSYHKIYTLIAPAAL